MISEYRRILREYRRIGGTLFRRINASNAGTEFPRYYKIVYKLSALRIM